MRPHFKRSGRTSFAGILISSCPPSFVMMTACKGFLAPPLTLSASISRAEMSAAVRASSKLGKSTPASSLSSQSTVWKLMKKRGIGPSIWRHASLLRRLQPWGRDPLIHVQSYFGEARFPHHLFALFARREVLDPLLDLAGLLRQTMVQGGFNWSAHGHLHRFPADG